MDALRPRIHLLCPAVPRLQPVRSAPPARKAARGLCSARPACLLNAICRQALSQHRNFKTNSCSRRILPEKVRNSGNTCLQLSNVLKNSCSSRRGAHIALKPRRDTLRHAPARPRLSRASALHITCLQLVRSAPPARNAARGLCSARPACLLNAICRQALSQHRNFKTNSCSRRILPEKVRNSGNTCLLLSNVLKNSCSSRHGTHIALKPRLTCLQPVRAVPPARKAARRLRSGSPAAFPRFRPAPHLPAARPIRAAACSCRTKVSGACC